MKWYNKERERETTRPSLWDYAYEIRFKGNQPNKEDIITHLLISI